MKQPDKTQGKGIARLAAVQQRLQREIDRRKKAEAALTQSQKHYSQLLAQSSFMQKQLQHLSRQILLAQEEERKHISHELHDEISQILTGINVRLAALMIECSANSGNIRKKIVNTQRLVEKSVAAVHKFARELRPAMLDDLGLVPALLSYLKELGRRTGLHIQLSAPAVNATERLDSLHRTVLYRVAQEALTNVAKHAHASMAKVSIRVRADILVMEISDNGTAFNVERVLGAKRRIRLGIIGMRERVEMVGGSFAIESVPGTGTTVRVQIPCPRQDAENELSMKAAE